VEQEDFQLVTLVYAAVVDIAAFKKLIEPMQKRNFFFSLNKLVGKEKQGS
jgi:hypothetical protein